MFLSLLLEGLLEAKRVNMPYDGPEIENIPKIMLIFLSHKIFVLFGERSGLSENNVSY